MFEKWELLKQEIKKCKSVLVAFSGGADSTLVLKAAQEALGKEVIAATADAPIISRKEIIGSINTAEAMGVEHVIVPVDIFSVNEFLDNTPERCYYCKKEIFSKLKETAEKCGMRYVIDGTNADDCIDYRPGIKALSELKINSLLAAVGISKQEARDISKKLGLRTWDRPSNACLATRIPYNETISTNKLRSIEEAEKYLEFFGFKQFRVRAHGCVARIEIPIEESNRILMRPIRQKIAAGLEAAGFTYAALDIRGFRSGSLNKMI